MDKKENMNLIEESYTRLFPNQELPYTTYLEYNKRLADFNANIKLEVNHLSLHLNLQWKDIDKEIKIGLVQSLILKILKKRTTTPNIDLYNNFIKQIPLLTPKTETDPILEASFHRLNEQFFFNQMEKPNLKWGKDSHRKLAHYNFHDDSVTVSTLFKETPQEILDYLMYHELLHKKHQFNHKNGRSSFHSPAFKEDEAQYPQYKDREQDITGIIRKKKRVRFWNWF